MLRRGVTLIELIIALSMTGIVLGGAVNVAVRQQGFYRDLSLAHQRVDQQSQTLSLLPIELRGVSPAEGDIVPGQARDTSLQVRATIASAIVCDTAGSMVTLAPAGVEGPTLASILSAPEPGDTLWSLVLTEDDERWQARVIAAVQVDSAGCALGGVDATMGHPGRRFRVAVSGVASPSTPGTPIRITRPIRYSVYRSGDGEWYLGIKDWNPTVGRFNGVQPVAGPFRRAASAGFRFMYYDANGAEVPSGATVTSRIARVDLTLASDTATGGGRGLITALATSSATVAFRNRIP